MNIGENFTELLTSINLNCYLPEKAQAFARLFEQV